MSERRCRDGCGTIITGCNGEVDAGDFLDAFEGKIPVSAVRERCGRCAGRKLLAKEGLVPPPSEDAGEENGDSRP